MAPLVQIDESLWLMELFHGPTLAFKDVALQLLGRLYDLVLKSAASASPWSAPPRAIPARRRWKRARTARRSTSSSCIPKGRVSEVQRRQMTTIDAGNVHNIAIDGSFDDCQDMVKAMFNDHAIPRPRQHVGGELDQLGARDGADRLLRDRCAGLGRPGPRRQFRRAIGQFRQCLRRLCRDAPWACRSTS